MPAYEEIIPAKKITAGFLLLAFILIYSPFQLDNWQLRRRESRYAAIAYEMNLTQPNTIIHGEQVPFHYPLYPWLAAILHHMGLSLELALRILSVLSLAMISILVWEAGRRSVDLQTGVVSAAMMFSSIIIIEKTLDGYPHLTALLFISTAWFSWFTLGVVKSKWNTAWIVSFLFCGLGFYTLGWTAVIYFLFPLIFMRRPMTVWPKLKKTGFWFGLLILLTFVLAWGIPRWYTGYDLPFQSVQLFPKSIKEYFLHILFFPVDVIFRFLPWSILAWPVFCVAFMPLDKNPIFSRFLRTIVISLFFLLCFSPFTDARDEIFLAPALSVLCGINYWLLIRRHGHQVHRYLRLLAYASGIAAIGITFFYLTDFPWKLDLSFIPTDLHFRSENRVLGLIQAFLALACAGFAIIASKKGLHVFSHAIFISVSASLIFWSVIIPYRSMHKKDKIMGNAFAASIKKDLHIPKENALPKNLVVYKGPGILGLVAPCLYMNARVRKIHKIENIPDIQNTVYMIGTDFPVSGNRTWTNISPLKKNDSKNKNNPFVYKNTRFYIFKGIKNSTEKEQ